MTFTIGKKLNLICRMLINNLVLRKIEFIEGEKKIKKKRNLMESGNII